MVNTSVLTLALSWLKVLRTLLAYVFVGLPVALPFLVLLPFISRKGYAFEVWYAIDVFICTVAHNTRYRTISGWTGEKALTKKRYVIQELFIDGLVRFVGGNTNHCFDAYLWEKRQGFTDGG